MLQVIARDAIVVVKRGKEVESLRQAYAFQPWVEKVVVKIAALSWLIHAIIGIAIVECCRCPGSQNSIQVLGIDDEQFSHSRP